MILILALVKLLGAVFAMMNIYMAFINYNKKEYFLTAISLAGLLSSCCMIFV